MKVAFSWLKQYADLNLSVEETARLLTDCGLEIDAVEEVESIRGGLKGLVVGEVLTCAPHPDSDHLHLTTVNVGSGEPLPIVCGAPNVAAGQKVIVATVGTVLYDGDKSFTIKKSKLRGADSFGMICAEDEIGVGQSHDGIMVLPPDTPVGMSAARYFHLESETVFEIGLTPNRSDATSHIGVARDLVALENIRNHRSLSLKYPSVTDFEEGNGVPVEVQVEAPLDAPRYSGLCMKNVKVGPSPEWLQKRLSSIGLRPINNVVDVTNFVLMETGQPMHAFDRAKIKGNRIVVRHARAGEKMTTLDGVERTLDPNDLMICNESEPMCIAGVFGGLDAGVSDSTTEVFLESAYFNPVSIRKTARRHALNTDASFRYERGCDPEICLYALKRAALLLKEVAGAEIDSTVTDLYPKPVERAKIRFTLDYLNRLIGEEMKAETVEAVLRALEMEVAANGGADARDITFEVTVPCNKTDVTRPADLVEEFLRIYGYNRIAEHNRISYGVVPFKSGETERVQTKVSDYLSASGFYEILNNSLCSESYIEKFGLQDTVKMLNPLSRETSLMRTTLLFGGLTSVARNLHHKQGNIRFYEFGRTYFRTAAAGGEAAEKDVTKRYREENHLGMWLCGNRNEEIWQEAERAEDFYTLKANVEKLWKFLRLDTLACKVSELEKDHEFLYGLRIALPGGKTGVRFGEVAPSVCKAFDIKQKVFYADFDWDAVLNALPRKAPQFREVNRFPEVRRDLALLVDKNVDFAQIEAVARKSEKSLLRKVSLFDVYEGKNLPEGKKSYAVSFILQDEGKTLTDKQIEKAMEKITANLQNELGCSLR